MLHSFRVFAAGFAAAAVILSSIWIYTEVAESNPSSAALQENFAPESKQLLASPTKQIKGQESPGGEKHLNQILKVNRELAHLEKTNRDARQQLSKARQKLRDQSRKQASFQERIEKLEKELTNLQNENEQLHADLGKKDRKLAVLLSPESQSVQARHRAIPDLIQEPRRILSIHDIQTDAIPLATNRRVTVAKEVQPYQAGADSQIAETKSSKAKAVSTVQKRSKKKPRRTKKNSSIQKYKGRWVASGKFFVHRGRLCKRYSMKPPKCFNKTVRQGVLTLRGRTCRVHKSGRIFCLIRHG